MLERIEEDVHVIDTNPEHNVDGEDVEDAYTDISSFQKPCMTEIDLQF